MNPLTAGSSSASSGVLSSLTTNQSRATDIQTMLSTNKKILDPAQQGVVTRLGSQVASFGASQNNIAKAQNVLSVASTGLKSIANILTQMQDLANKASDATMTTADSDKLNQTFQSLLKQLDSTAKNTKIDGTGLLNSSAINLKIQTGLTTDDTTDIQAVKSDSTSLSVEAQKIDTAANAKTAIAKLQTALDSVSTNQSTVASDQLALSTQDTLISTISQNLQNTIDSIEKPDAAALQMELQANNNQQSMNYYLINQMNQQAQSVLTIFR
jgi:flagellin